MTAELTTIATDKRDEPIVIEPKKGWLAIDFAELWQFRELLYFLVWRDLKVRYKQTVLGGIWAIFQPLLTMVIFSVIFGSFLGISSEGLPYPLFVYAALMPWICFQNSVSQATVSLVTQTSLLTKTYFPRIFMPLGAVLTAVADFVLAFLIYVGIMAWYRHTPGAAVLLVGPLTLLLIVTSLGVGLFFAGITVAYRDFRIVVMFLLQAWMYASPVVYPMAAVPDKYRLWMALNPMTGVIDGFRSALLGLPMDWPVLGSSAVVASVLLVVGAFNFRRTERRFADVV